MATDRKRSREIKAPKERKRTKIAGAQTSGGESKFFSDALMPALWEHIFVNVVNGQKVPLGCTIYNKTSWRNSKYLNLDGTVDADRWIQSVNMIMDNYPCFEKTVGVKNLSPSYVKYSLLYAEGYEDLQHIGSQFPVNDSLRNDYDFLIVATQDTNGQEISCALLIAQRGECEESPGSWVVRIICNSSVIYPPAFWMPDSVYSELGLTKAGEKQKYLSDGFAETWLDSRENRAIVEQRPCLTGNHLMGAFIYAAKNWNSGPDSSTALLELANGYENPQGYCLYDKFGFVRTGHIDEKKCAVFLSTSIEMRVDLDSLSYAELVATVQTTKKMRYVGGTMVEVPKDVFCTVNRSDQDEFRAFDKKINELKGKLVNTPQDVATPPRSTRGNPLAVQPVITKKTRYMIALENLVKEKRSFDQYMAAKRAGG